MAEKYRILSLDGGGIRGVLTARLLERIVEQHPTFVTDTDLFAGTSTGSILAIGLAMGISPARLVALYREQGSVIFADSLWDDIKDLGGLSGAKYSTHNRLRGILPTIGQIRLKEIKKRVLVSTFQLDSTNPISPAIGQDQRTWKAKFFHNFPGSDSDGEQSAIDVIMRSSAAPTYFPIYQGYIDGGVVANNPSMCALAQAISSSGGQALKDVVLTSMSTGCKLEFIDSFDGDWGYVQWIPQIINLLFESGSGLADYQCRQLLGDRYLRLDPNLHEAIELDAVDAIDLLIEKADEFFTKKQEDILAWVRAQW